MYCPNCAAPIDGVKYCRSCGANVSLVPQALSGQLLESLDDEVKGKRGKRNRRQKQETIEKAVTTFFTGIGFIVAAFAVMFYFPGGFTWGWSFFIPAFICIGEGVGQYLRVRQQQQQLQREFQLSMQQPYLNAPYTPPAPIQPNPPLEEPSAPTTSNLASPSSITENTTKNLDATRQRN